MLQTASTWSDRHRTREHSEHSAVLDCPLRRTLHLQFDKHCQLQRRISIVSRLVQVIAPSCLKHPTAIRRKDLFQTTGSMRAGLPPYNGSNMHSNSKHTLILSSEGQAGQYCEPSNKVTVFRITGNIGQKSTLTLLFTTSKNTNC